MNTKGRQQPRLIVRGCQRCQYSITNFSLHEISSLKRNVQYLKTPKTAARYRRGYLECWQRLQQLYWRCLHNRQLQAARVQYHVGFVTRAQHVISMRLYSGEVIELLAIVDSISITW